MFSLYTFMAAFIYYSSDKRLILLLNYIIYVDHYLSYETGSEDYNGLVDNRAT